MSSTQHEGPAAASSQSPTTLTVHGDVAPGFEGVRHAFEANFKEHGEVGAAFALYHQGRKVVDLRGGVSDKTSMAGYGDDTLQLVFSSTKGVTALCANLLAQRGQLDMDAPVSQYWPEFAAAGKAEIPVRYLLSHQVGLPYIETPLTLAQYLAWEPAVEALAAQAPLWEPGTQHGYHAITYGYLVGEIIRRTTGKTVGQMVEEELAGPLGLDLWVGLPAQFQDRVAPLTYTGMGRGQPDDDGVAGTGMGGQDMASVLEQFLGPDSLLLKALDSSPGVFTERGVFNRPEVRQAEIPSANGVTNARSLARLYAATVGTLDDGPGAGQKPLLNPAQQAAATVGEVDGSDAVLMVKTRFGLGYMRSGTYSPYGGPRSFGHSGAGGSLGFADPEHELGFGYAMNRMKQSLAGDPRSQGLIRSTYEAIGIEPTYI